LQSTYSMDEVWWRAEAREYAAYDPRAEWGQPAGSVTRIEMTSYPVIHHTPKGVLIKYWDGSKDTKFILGNAARQWAVPTQELALKDLKCRIEGHISILNARVATAERQKYIVGKILGCGNYGELKIH